MGSEEELPLVAVGCPLIVPKPWVSPGEPTRQRLCLSDFLFLLASTAAGPLSCPWHLFTTAALMSSSSPPSSREWPLASSLGLGTLADLAAGSLRGGALQSSKGQVLWSQRGTQTLEWHLGPRGEAGLWAKTGSAGSLARERPLSSQSQAGSG